MRQDEEDRARAPQEFVEVYDAYLGPVWRFVRSRVPDHHEAEDVTSDAFARAWRAWARFDPAKGSAAAWMFSIARRAVADYWRRAPRHAAPQDPFDEEHPAFGLAGSGLDMTRPGTPEGALLEDDRLREVGQALAVLNDHDREVLALRFGAELKVREIAEVLSVTTGAVKMTIHRALVRLRTHLEIAHEPVLAAARPADEGEVLVLDSVIEAILDRGHPELSDRELGSLVLHLAAVHTPAVPDDLPQRIATCVSCETSLGEGPDDSPPSVLAAARTPERFRTVGGGLWILLLGPACLVCVAPLWITPPLAIMAAAGLGAVPEIGHYIGLAFAPVIAWLTWRNQHSHGLLWPSRLAVAGAVTLAIHALLHLDAVGSTAFVISDWLGWGLLTVAVVGDVTHSLRRRREQRRWLEVLTARA